MTKSIDEPVAPFSFPSPASPAFVVGEAERLRREHGELEARLAELARRVWLSPQEELEKKQLQKLKLAKKDRLLALGA
ncbi:YdcH family protein [Myxococcota bacterium]|nr:YdcH family protein [Myxococcota bacterium]